MVVASVRISTCAPLLGSLGRCALPCGILVAAVKIAYQRFHGRTSYAFAVVMVPVSSLSSLLVSWTKGRNLTLENGAYQRIAIVCQEGWPLASGSGCGSWVVLRPDCQQGPCGETECRTNNMCIAAFPSVLTHKYTLFYIYHLLFTNQVSSRGNGTWRYHWRVCCPSP